MSVHHVTSVHSATRTEDGADIHLWLDCSDGSILSIVIDRNLHASLSVIEADGPGEEHVAGLAAVDLAAALLERFTRTPL